VKKWLTRIWLGRPGRTFWLCWTCRWAEEGERLALRPADPVWVAVSVPPWRSRWL